MIPVNEPFRNDQSDSKAHEDYTCDYWACNKVLPKGVKRTVFHLRGTYKNFYLCDRCAHNITLLGYDKVVFNYLKDYSVYLTDLAGKVITFDFEGDQLFPPEISSSDPKTSSSSSPANPGLNLKPHLVNGVDLNDLHLACRKCRVFFLFIPVKLPYVDSMVYTPYCQNYGCESSSFTIFYNNRLIGTFSGGHWNIFNGCYATSDLFPPSIALKIQPKSFKGVIIRCSTDKQSVLFLHLSQNRQTWLTFDRLFDFAVIPTESFQDKPVYLVTSSVQYYNHLHWGNLDALPGNVKDRSLTTVEGQVLDYFEDMRHFLFLHNETNKKYVIPAQNIHEKNLIDDDDESLVELVIDIEILINRKYEYFSYPIYSFKTYFTSSINENTFFNKYFSNYISFQLNSLEKDLLVKSLFEKSLFERDWEERKAEEIKANAHLFTKKNILRSLGLPLDLESVDYCITCNHKLSDNHSDQDIVCPECSFALEDEIYKQTKPLDNFVLSQELQDKRKFIDFLNTIKPDTNFNLDHNEIIFCNNGIIFQNSFVKNFYIQYSELNKTCTVCSKPFNTSKGLLTHYLTIHERKINNSNLTNQIVKQGTYKSAPK